VKIETWDGRPIAKSGAFKGIPIDKYHSSSICAGPSTSSGDLRILFSKSPAHCWNESRLNPNRSSETEKAHFSLGRATHHLLLGERWFSKAFVIQPSELVDPRTGELRPWQGNRTVCREWLETARKSGRTPLTADAVENIKGMAMALGRESLVIAGILRGQIEVSLVFRDKETGLFVRARPDAIPTDSGDFADLKTTADILNVDKSIRSYRYDMQAGVVRWACREVLGIEMSSFSLIFVESAPPHCVQIVTLEQQDLDEGEADARVALRTFAHCLKTKRWFGPQGSQRDARAAYFSDTFREQTKFRRELLAREISKPGG